MAKFGRSFTKTFVPSFRQSYEQGQRYAYLQQQKEDEQAQQNLERAAKIQEAEIKQAKANEDMRLFRLLGQGGENYPNLVEGGQQFVPFDRNQKIDIISRLNITPNEKFQQIEKLNAPEKRDLIYSPDKEFAYEKLPTGQVVKTDIPNDYNFKPIPKIEFKRDRKYDKNLGKWAETTQKYKDGELQDEDIKYLEPYKPDKSGNPRLEQWANNMLDQKAKAKLNALNELSGTSLIKSTYNPDTKAWEYQKEGKIYDTASLRVKNETIAKQAEKDYEETINTFLSPQAQKIINRLWNTQSGKKNAKELAPKEDFWKTVIENFKSGYLNTSDVEVLKHKYFSTYGELPNAR